MEKTIVIFDQCGEDNISYFVLDGDHRYLNKQYVNDDCTDEADETIGALQSKAQKHEFPYDVIQEVMDNGGKYHVVACGFVP